jgi:hypothetical protein
MKSVRSQLHPLFGKGSRRMVIIPDQVLESIRRQFAKQHRLPIEDFIFDDLLQLERES